ncbi:MAG: RsmB/NOP family class I SAM-dependent RNA methyltransferase [Candidatus Thorarchaeota archaeon]
MMNSEQSARSEAIDALVEYEHSKTSMRTLLRDMQTTSADAPDFSRFTQSLAISVIRFQNTIDFLLTRSLGKQRPRDLDDRTRNILRLALFESRWQGVESELVFSNYPQVKELFYEEFLKAISIDLDSATQNMPLPNRLSLRLSHPSFLVETLLDNLGEKESVDLMVANNKHRFYYIRPNRLFGETDSVIESLSGVEFTIDNDVPEVYRIEKGVEILVSSDLFREGRLLIQDKASVATVNVLDPQPGEKIWDACAAPGMKTQLIAERLEGEGEIIATDIYEDRLEIAKNRSRQLEAYNITWLHADATKTPVLDADKILIDAPCTSTGVLQTYPSFKWRLNKYTLVALMTVQNKILDAVISAYSDRPGTEIVFSTCSILPHEGESQIDSVMKHHNIELLETPIFGDTGYSAFDCSERVQRLFPHRHQCSGFFISRFKIKH